MNENGFCLEMNRVRIVNKEGGYAFYGTTGYL